MDPALADASILERLLAVDSLITFGAIMLLLGLSGFFSGSETALTAASRARFQNLESEGHPEARSVNRLLADRERLIGAILLGNNLVNILASALATSLFLRLFGDAGVAIATAVMTAFIVVFAEVLPKTYAILNSDRMAMQVSPIIRLIVALFSPVVHAVQALVRATFRLFGAQVDPDAHLFSVREELRGTIQLHGEATADRAAHSEHRELNRDLRMVGGVLDLRDLEVGEVMLHRKAMYMVDADQPPTVLVDQILHAPHTRIPLWRGDSENIIGVLHVKDLLRALAKVDWDPDAVTFEDIVRAPWFVPETTELQVQLNAFLQKGMHFAMVVDEYGTLMGLITLEDIIEEIVGEIRDEHDEMVTGVRPQPDGSYNVDGTVTIRDLNRAMSWKLPDDEATTIAGLVIHEAQMIPDPGQTFTFHDFKFEVLRRKRNQITAVRVTPPPEMRARRLRAGIPRGPLPESGLAGPVGEDTGPGATDPRAET